MCYQRSSGKSSENPGTKETGIDKLRQRKGVDGLIMIFEIIPVLVESYNRAPWGSRSVGVSPGLRDFEDTVVSVLLVLLIAFIWCPKSKNSSFYVGG